MNKTGAVADVCNMAPDQPLLVVGDVHGSFELLQQCLANLDAFVENNWTDNHGIPRLVMVGDYVDRGEESARVLEWLYRLQIDLPDNVTCLMGNHEQMMLEFLDDPAGRGLRWLRNGGLQTLASYNIGNLRERSDVEELTEASQKLERSLPDGMLTWLRDLPLLYQSGNICVAHAGMDPRLAAEDQQKKVLLWGHKEFMSRPRKDDLWVVHGHTIVREPQIAPSRISIDTGAYYSGRLTAVAIGPGTCEFV